MSLTGTSRFIALILRHKPEAIGIKLDEHGWANVSELIEGISKKQPFNIEMLKEIVEKDEKNRYSFNKDKTLIRANQGHSIHVDVGLEKREPPEFLYHGTGQKYIESIKKYGIIQKSRLYVHLSLDATTAKIVGSRHGTPVILRVHAMEMYRSGYEFYISQNGIWMTKSVPIDMFEIQD